MGNLLVSLVGLAMGLWLLRYHPTEPPFTPERSPLSVRLWRIFIWMLIGYGTIGVVSTLIHLISK